MDIFIEKYRIVMSKSDGVLIEAWGKYLTYENRMEFMEWANSPYCPPRGKDPLYDEEIDKCNESYQRLMKLLQ